MCRSELSNIYANIFKALISLIMNGFADSKTIEKVMKIS